MAAASATTSEQKLVRHDIGRSLLAVGEIAVSLEITAVKFCGEFDPFIGQQKFARRTPSEQTPVYRSINPEQCVRPKKSCRSA
jgi:hypothetical protein